MKRRTTRTARAFQTDKLPKNSISLCIPRDKCCRDVSTTSRCCYVAPETADFMQEADLISAEEVSSLLEETAALDQYITSLNPLIPETIEQLKELRKAMYNIPAKVENSSQYTTLDELVFNVSNGTQWQDVEDADDIEDFLSIIMDDSAGDYPGKSERKPEVNSYSFESNIRIVETPKVKIIAEKFMKYKKDNIEVRKLEEKVVCLEYDIFDDGDPGNPEPVKKLRAFFSIKPKIRRYTSSKPSLDIPTVIKRKFEISNDDLKKLNDQEVEIIDGMITGNQSYLNDLKKVLKRKEAIYTRKKRSSMDLMHLYEMAKRETPSLDADFSNTNLLSKAELEQVKELVLQKSISSLRGISRKTFKDSKEQHNRIGVISQSIVAELLRDNDKQ